MVSRNLEARLKRLERINLQRKELNDFQQSQFEKARKEINSPQMQLAKRFLVRHKNGESYADIAKELNVSIYHIKKLFADYRYLVRILHENGIYDKKL